MIGNDSAPGSEEFRRFVRVKSCSVAKCANSAPCGFHLSPSLIDVRAQLWKQFFPHRDYVHSILAFVDEQRHPAQQYGTQPSKKVDIGSPNWCWNCHLLSQ